MNPKVKIGAYVVLAVLGIFFGSMFYRAYNKVMENPPGRGLPLQETDSTPVAVEEPLNNRTGRMMKYGAGLFFTIVGLALLASHDISKFLAARAEAFIVSDDGEAMHDPEYEEAERVWANGQPLEAIRLMREHLKKHPLHQYVALRIAEIYEKDLGNHLASALEYEEVLKHRLSPERWGWGAIHLANLYSGKLNKPAEAEAVLRRIVNEYGQTTAARKARERLGIPEPVDTPEPEPESDEDQTSESEPPQPPSNLPPGFRPKKS
jgi:hypothetical protein